MRSYALLRKKIIINTLHYCIYIYELANYVMIWIWYLFAYIGNNFIIRRNNNTHQYHHSIIMMRSTDIRLASLKRKQEITWNKVIVLQTRFDTSRVRFGVEIRWYTPVISWHKSENKLNRFIWTSIYLGNKSKSQN